MNIELPNRAIGYGMECVGRARSRWWIVIPIGIGVAAALAEIAAKVGL